jgi:hypothetical protein
MGLPGKPKGIDGAEVERYYFEIEGKLNAESEAYRSMRRTEVPEDIDKEVEAIKAVLTALEPLRPEVRSSVLGYVIGRLHVSVESKQDTERPLEPSTGTLRRAMEVEAEQQEPTHIKELKEKKKPRSAIEMAALVAYYLANLAPEKDRKDRITTKDINTYFKIADFPLPTKTEFTLPNTKGAGYLDSVGHGQYKLNAVGHNLVVHSMPRGESSTRAGKGHQAARKR